MYVDDVENKFIKLNQIYRNNLFFLENLDNESELCDFIISNINELSMLYRSFVYKNNIPLDRIPDDIRKNIFDNGKNFELKK